MPISDFFGTEAGFRLEPATALSFNGKPYHARPLTVAQTLQVWSQFAPYREEIIEAFSSLDPSRAPHFAEFLSGAFRIAMPAIPAADLDAATPEEINAAFWWYASAHRWDEVVRTLFGIGDEQPGEMASDEKVMDYFFLLESATHRKIEELLAMRVEAFLELVAAAERKAKRELDQVERAEMNAMALQPHEDNVSTGWIPMSIYDLPRAMAAMGGVLLPQGAPPPKADH